MKKFFSIFLLPAVMMAALSCTNEKIEIQKQVKVTVSPANVLKNFTPYSEGDLDMEEDAKLRISVFIYDDSGSLYHEEEALVDDYNSTYTFQVIFPEGLKYRAVSFCSSITGSLSKPTDESYTITGRDLLSTLKIQQKYIRSFYTNWSALGYDIRDLDADADDTVILLQPAVAYVTDLWTDIHSHDGGSSIYGSYTATAKDYWGENEYTWIMTIERDGTSDTSVLIKDLDPMLCKYGFTAENGCNTFKGTLDGSVITVPAGQVTGFKYNDTDNILEGVSKIEDQTLYFGDLYLDISGQTIVTRNPFGTYVPPGDSGWTTLYDSGITFSLSEGSEGSGGIDEYQINYRLNDIATTDGHSLEFSSSLAESKVYYNYIELSSFPSSTSIYDPGFFLPGTFNTFGRTVTGTVKKIYDSQEITVDAGKQYVLSFDCRNLKLNFKEGTLNTKSSVDGCEREKTKYAIPGPKFMPKRSNILED